MRTAEGEMVIQVFFFAGRYDCVTPGELAEDYFQTLGAPAKRFLCFGNSAHDVQYDESEKFSQEIIKIAQQVLAL
jgi:pimeloyl-ACP methyl ester carboxylesterase